MDDDILLETDSGEYPPLISEGRITVEAVCTAIKRFKAYGRDNYRFSFRIVQPLKHQGVILYCYAPYRSQWEKKLSTGCKLHKMAVVATGQRKLRRITRAMFLHKAFICEVEKTGKGEAAYSVVRNILRVTAGS